MHELHCVLLREHVSSSFGCRLLVLGDRAFSLLPPCRAWHGALAGEGVPQVHTEQVHAWVSC